MLRQVKLVSRSKISDFLLCVISAILLSLSFSSFNIWIFAWFGFVPLFFALQNKSRIQAFLISFFAGVLFWSCAIYWLVHVTLIGTAILVLYLALYFGIFGLIIRLLFGSTQARQAASLLFIPAVWVVLEYVRGTLFSGFPWALLAYSQYTNLPAIQIVDITGAWGVSFMVMFVNVGVFEILGSKVTKPQNHKLSFLLLSIVCFVVFGYGYFRLYLLSAAKKSQPEKIAVIQANIPQELKWDYIARNYIINKYSFLTKQSALENPDLIVWPEASNPDILGEESVILSNILNLAKEIKTPILIGSVVKEEENYFNSALLIGSSGAIMNRYDKLHLVPFGEYIPLKKVLPFLQTVVPIGDMFPGKQYTIFNHGLMNYSVLICFEDVFPELSRKFVAQGADFLVNITNDGWYKETSAPFQHLAASVFRAVENRVPLARSANTGISGFISSSGKVDYFSSGSKKIFAEGYKTGEVYLNSRPGRTVYNRLGDFFVAICFVIAVIGLAL